MPLLLVLAVACFASGALPLRVVDPLVPGPCTPFRHQPRTGGAVGVGLYAPPYALGQPVLGALGDALGKVRIIQVCLALMAAGLCSDRCWRPRMSSCLPPA